MVPWKLLHSETSTTWLCRMCGSISDVLDGLVGGGALDLHLRLAGGGVSDQKLLEPSRALVRQRDQHRTIAAGDDQPGCGAAAVRWGAALAADRRGSRAGVGDVYVTAGIEHGQLVHACAALLRQEELGRGLV